MYIETFWQDWTTRYLGRGDVLEYVKTDFDYIFLNHIMLTLYGACVSRFIVRDSVV